MHTVRKAYDTENTYTRNKGRSTLRQSFVKTTNAVRHELTVMQQNHFAIRQKLSPMQKKTLIASIRQNISSI